MEEVLPYQNLSVQFGEKIDSIQSSFFSALSDFQKYYVYFNKNPEVNEFQNFYVNSKSQLQSLNKNLLSTTNKINETIQDLDKDMSNISTQLEEEKRISDDLAVTLQNYENTQNGSEILIGDSKEMYNTQYYYNWEIFIGIFLVSGLLVKGFKG